MKKTQWLAHLYTVACFFVLCCICLDDILECINEDKGEGSRKIRIYTRRLSKSPMKDGDRFGR